MRFQMWESKIIILICLILTFWDPKGRIKNQFVSDWCLFHTGAGGASSSGSGGLYPRFPTYWRAVIHIALLGAAVPFWALLNPSNFWNKPSHLAVWPSQIMETMGRKWGGNQVGSRMWEKEKSRRERPLVKNHATTGRSSARQVRCFVVPRPNWRSGCYISRPNNEMRMNWGGREFFFL